MTQDDITQTHSAKSIVNTEASIHDAMLTSESSDNSGQASGPLSLDTLPEDVRNQMPEDAQRIFMTAYNSILEGNNDPEAANRVAWQTIDRSEQFVKGKDGTYQRVAGVVKTSAPSPLSAS